MNGLRAIALMLLALSFMALDHRVPRFHQMRNALSVVVMPLKFAVDTPIQFVHWIVVSVTAQQRLLDENARLRAHEFLLQSKLQKLLSLERENAELKGLLRSVPRITGHVKVAQLMALSLDPTLHQIVIDKGSHQSVYVGQPVLDAYGVIGQIVDVSLFTSKVMLLTDMRSALPVMDHRNGVRAIAMGNGDQSRLTLINVPDTTDVRQGDLFVTSGLGLHFPVGYPVGVVREVKHVPGERFAMITLTPTAHFDRTQQVLLAWPDQHKLSQAVSDELHRSLPKSPGSGKRD